jgi:RNA polymerase sigma-70 factor (ECF subfamily)
MPATVLCRHDLGRTPLERTADLLARAAAGDSRAYDRLFARVAPRLEWYVAVRLGPELRARVEPADVVQETYAAALQQLGGFAPRGEGAFLRWLFAIAGHQVLRLSEHHGADHRRAVARGADAAAALALAADPLSGPCTRAERLEVRERLQRALLALEHDARLAVTARVLEGRPLAEVAAALGRSESAARRLVAGALARLGRELAGGTRHGD